MIKDKRMFPPLFITITVLVLGGVCFLPVEARETEREIKQRMVRAAKDELNNTVWEVKMRPITDNKKKSKVEMDTLRFENYKIGSDSLNSDGFGATNYTLRLKGKDNNIVIWETMQTSENKGVAFWKGEIESGMMSGVLSRHINDKNKKDYSFVSISKRDIAAAVSPQQGPVETKADEYTVPAVPQEEVAPPPPTKPAPKKEEKKKGWFFWQ